MTVFASQLNRHWSDGTAFDIEPERRALTLRIIVRALFGVESPDTAQHMAPAFALCYERMYLSLTQPPVIRSSSAFR